MGGRTPLKLAASAASSDEPSPRLKLAPWLEQFAKKRQRTSEHVGKIQYFNALGAELPAHIVAPELVLTPVGHCPKEGGKVKQLPRGIRNNTRRSAPTSPSCKV